MDEEIPTCDKCGAPIETGSMALLCPLRAECGLWPEGMDPAGEFAQRFPLDYTPEQVQRMRDHCEKRARSSDAGSLK